MTTPAQKKWIQILHVAKRECGLDDDAYRAVLAGAWLRRYHKRPLFAGTHIEQHLVPAGNHLARTHIEFNGAAVLPGSVDQLTGKQRQPVVGPDFLTLTGLAAAPLFAHHIPEPDALFEALGYLT